MSDRNRWMIAAAAAAVLVAGSGVVAQQQQKGKPAPPAMTGPDVGTKAPAFTLKDQDGKERSLGDLLGKGKVALVFTRSADW